jgi:hypothetical protein
MYREGIFFKVKIKPKTKASIYLKEKQEKKYHYLENGKYLSFQTRDSIQNILINVPSVTSGIQYLFQDDLMSCIEKEYVSRYAVKS